MMKLTIVGNIGADPDLRYSASGSPVLRLNVASNYRTKTQAGEWEERTEWCRVTILGQRAESLSQHLRKGMKIYADGRLEARPWTDNNGHIRAGLEILADTIEFMSARQNDEAQAASSPARRMPESVAVHGARPAARGGAIVADRDDGDLGDLPF